MKNAPRPYGLLAELTHRCPLHCPYCSNPKQLVPRGDELDVGRWIDAIQQAAALGVLQVGLSGGEPLLYPHLIQLVQAARSAGLYTNLITSAVGLSGQRAEDLRNAGLDTIQISFQADDSSLADEIAGVRVHAQKLAAVRAVLEAGLPWSANIVLHRRNIDRIESLIAFVYRLGALRVELANTQFYGWAFPNRHQLLPSRAQVDHAVQVVTRARLDLAGRMQIVYVRPDYHEDRPKPCLHGWGARGLTINPRGDVLPCQAAEAISGMHFDNVRERSLAWIWAESDAFNRFRGTEWMPEPCQSCDFKEIDFGGCRCQAALLTGDAASTDPVCVLSPHRFQVDAALRQSEEVSGEWLYRGNA